MQDKTKGFFGIHLKAISLHRKILLSMVVLLLMSGLAMVLITRTVLSGMLKTEFQHKGLSCAKSLSANSLVDVLTQNKPRLQRLIDNEKKLDKDIAYIFIVDSSGRLLAHTFAKGFPVDLRRVNTMQENNAVRIQPLDTQFGRIYDIAAPVSSEKNVVGQVRVGVNQNSIQRVILILSFVFTITTLFIMLIGILLAYKLSSLITRPISKLVEATQSIQKGDFSAKININTKDEIALLATSFNEMTARLRQLVEEEKRLKVAEERNRIAFELHDGCAQNMANIIKRLELCERLFKIAPQKALEELDSLKEVTRNILNQTRQAIFDLKSPEDADFSLRQRLEGYLSEYERQGDIDIKLDADGPLENIGSHKAKTIFYIIREALTNIKKHARAKNIQLRLACNDSSGLEVNIKDDGVGFNIAEAELSALRSGKWGLASMRQRAASLGGSLAISSVPGKGTGVAVNIP